MRQIVQAGGIVMNPKGQIVVILSDTGRHTLPKGSCENGETFEQTARREIQEETGLRDITIHEELGVLSRPGFTADNHQEPSVMKNIHIFLCTTDETLLKSQDPAVIAVQWVDVNKAAGILSWPEEVAFFQKQRAKLKL